MNVPPMSSDVPATLHVIGSFSTGYHIEAFKDILIRHNTILTFIQTDKPLYKPGQTSNIFLINHSLWTLWKFIITALQKL